MVLLLTRRALGEFPMKNVARFLASLSERMPDSVWVACGGVLGTLARYGMDQRLLPPQALPAGFPWPTLVVNISGAALLGFIVAWVEESDHPPRWLKPGAGIGFCGAYTTFSTASVEILLLARDGRSAVALSYLSASLVFGLLAVTITTAIAVKIFKNPHAAGERPQT